MPSERKMMQCYLTDDNKYVVFEFATANVSVAIPLTRDVNITVNGVPKKCRAP